ncbi:uncharacterized protein si:ch211-266a5.12 [Chanodichthys erythropterus]|uniref:uncharacterized protein si:ch211-266a5.12 n=1 Tax=Chanodichthys erythropterus TaxID=933992 RepID=UPI00351EA7C8
MASALQYFVLILILGIPIHEGAVVYQNGKCIDVRGPCFDLNLLANIAERVSKDVVAADGEKILLKHNSFDKIRKRKNLHSCVLQKIIDLFQNVLEVTEESSVHHEENMNYHRELIHIMEQLKNCVHQVKYNCNKLYTKSEKTATSLSTILEKKMSPDELAVLQLQKLKNASDNLNDVHIQERVMDELKTLHLYMRGKGFRKNMNDKKEA